jgi:phosphatidylserine/phosphatidylglycerophosphate/cardiolipin synthase-like enzyme
MKMGQRIAEIRQMGQMREKSQIAEENGKGEIMTSGMIKMAMIVGAMCCFPFILRHVDKVLDSRMPQARPGAATVSGAHTGTAVGGAATSGGVLREGQYRIYYAPEENLEREDVQIIASARSSIDAALYSDTDETLCDAMATAAAGGVIKVRVYRDREQYEEEEKRAHGRDTCTAKLIASGAEVRVKSSEELMHLKSYAVDGRILRSGSANMSIGGEKYQDNDVVFLASVSAAKGFENNFDRIWSRENNEVIGSVR